MSAVAEAVHNKNGNVSFGNRKHMSSLHACLRVQRMMREHKNGYVLTIDLQGYFMSINREVAWRVFCEYEQQNRPAGYSDAERDFILWLSELLIKNDPSVNCERRSPERLWAEHVKPHKSLFGNDGRGMPIGNYYSQIIANLLPERVCEVATKYNMTEFVDDFALIVDSPSEATKAEREIDAVLSLLGLRRNAKKRYLQPVRHGVLWCGYKIYADRLYTSNRTIHNCERKAVGNATERSARRLQQTLNSYFGMMAHANEYKTQRRIADTVSRSAFAEWLYFSERPGHIVCKLRGRYKPTGVSANEIRETQKYIYTYDSHTSQKWIEAPAA